MEVKIGKFLEEQAREAVTKLGDSHDRAYLEDPYNGFFVTRIKPSGDGKEVKRFFDDEGEVFFLVCEDILGGAT